MYNLWDYYRDEVEIVANEIVTNYKRNNTKTTTSISFE